MRASLFQKACRANWQVIGTRGWRSKVAAQDSTSVRIPVDSRNSFPETAYMSFIQSEI
jgi:hypothetical protein